MLDGIKRRGSSANALGLYPPTTAGGNHTLHNPRGVGAAGDATTKRYVVVVGKPPYRAADVAAEHDSLATMRQVVSEMDPADSKPGVAILDTRTATVVR